MNSNTVYVTCPPDGKDLRDAERFGDFKIVLPSIFKPYSPQQLLARARRELSGMQPGDYLLMIGDPMLCGICMTVAAEKVNTIRVLSWDKQHGRYEPVVWDLDEYLN